jgi:hypothetical protein
MRGPYHSLQVPDAAVRRRPKPALGEGEMQGLEAREYTASPADIGGQQKSQ